MAKKAKFPKDMINDEIINKKNMEWIKNFRENTQKDENYYKSIEQIFRYKINSNKPFNEYSISDIEDYVEVMVENDFSVSRIDAILSHLDNYRNYLITKYPEEFKNGFLDSLNELKFGDTELKNEDSKALNLVQLKAVKDFIKNNIKSEYIFEIFFQLGIHKKDFYICNAQYANKEDMLFINGEKVFKYNTRIKVLLDKIENNHISVSYDMISKHLKKIEKYLKARDLFDEKKSLTYFDIIKTHEVFVVSCPICGNKTELLSPNWVLLKIDNDDDLYLVCSNCKGEDLYE